uniref:ZP domain-containing protein n=1 Tax=Eptatretus burgeri TaxID=7764 RepID=A0A8C4PWP5_EPTBU
MGETEDFQCEALYETDPSHVRYSFTLLLKDNVTLETKTNFTVTCRAPAAQISCFPNGTVAFTAPRVDIKPPVDMSKLALHDSSCGPQKVGPNGAYFEFGVDTCGTLRKLHDDFLVYENEVSVPRETLSFGHTFITRDNVYRLKVTCSYRLNDTLSLIASARSGQRARFEFAPVLPIQMVFRQADQHEMDLTFRMAKDEHFSEYYVPSEYPVVKFLQDPLFFEVRLLGLNYKNIELFLHNCWATERPNRDSIPQWPVISKR